MNDFIRTDEGRARTGRARSSGEGGPMVDPTQAPASDASGSAFMADPAQAPAPDVSGPAGGAAGPAAGEEARRAPDRAVP